MPPKAPHICHGEGREPFSEWLASLRDIKARAKVPVRLDRVSWEILATAMTWATACRSFASIMVQATGGISVKRERRLSCSSVVVTRVRRPEDIETAKRYWSEYRRRS